ncbi:Noc2-domain-containing protein [Hesseltinella vesiculosa]|uniref:Noc2-domain-containing protein n=1 Tax=Hesseltinella vesiculosa TaxID=101127 RepID=A0A1X2GYE0_9FUNG|nr:Noc2-domain-containing protein [Hesseltinella vesiculosa]
MGKATKQTVKFQKNRLKQTLERRRKQQKQDESINKLQDIVNKNTYFCNFTLDSEEDLDLEEDKDTDLDILNELDAAPSIDEDGNSLEIGFIDNDDMEDDEEEDDDMDEDSDAPLVTPDLLKEWKEQLKRRSPQAFRLLLLAFKAIAKDDDEPATYRVNNSKVYMDIITTTTTCAYPILSDHLILNKKVRHPSKTRFWTRLSPVVQLLLNNAVRILRDLDQDDLLIHILTNLEPCSIYFGCFPKLANEYLRVLLDRWADLSLTSEARLVCYKAIRALGTQAVDATSKQNFLPHALKGVYLTFAKRATKINEQTMDGVQQMMEEAADLYAVDPKLSQPHAHVYLQQLADHLKTARKAKTVENFKSIYTWQYVMCLDFWSNVIAVTCHPEQGQTAMQELLPPVIDLSLVTMRLNPTAQFLPLRIHVLRSLIALIDSTGFFVPLAPYLFEVFENDIFRSNVQHDPTLAPFLWECHLKAPKQYVNTKVYQSAVYQVTHDMILDYYACFGMSIAYPELAVPAINKLKEQRERFGGSRFLKSLKQLIEKMETHKNYIEQKRTPIEYTPTAMDEASSFLRNTAFESTPLGNYLKKREAASSS